jgi:pSer/pThr/pTyr-binding forkhead associated (FHA) protein
MGFELKLTDGPFAARRVALPPKGELVVGRGRQTDLKIPDPQLSRRHCVFRCDGDEVTLTDLGSQNGTFVNGVAAKSAPLEAGDRVAFGATVAKLILG